MRFFFKLKVLELAECQHGAGAVLFERQTPEILSESLPFDSLVGLKTLKLKNSNRFFKIPFYHLTCILIKVPLILVSLSEDNYVKLQFIFYQYKLVDWDRGKE